MCLYTFSYTLEGGSLNHSKSLSLHFITYYGVHGQASSILQLSVMALKLATMGAELNCLHTPPSGTVLASHDPWPGSCDHEIK